MSSQATIGLSGREPNLPLLLTLQQVSELTGYSERSISRYWKAGEFPAPIRVRATLRWRLRDVLDWIDNHGTCDE
jgi:predicted DNA-binding transcriptional regulator AlpA